MKKFLVAGLALSILGGSAVSAAAQPGYRYDQRQDVREQRRDVRDARRELREERRELRQERREFRRAERRYRAGRYVAPRGYAVRSWRYGDRLPSGYYASRYRIADYNRYGLYAPPRGYQWTRVGDDAILTAVATGVVAGAIYSLFQ